MPWELGVDSVWERDARHELIFFEERCPSSNRGTSQRSAKIKHMVRSTRHEEQASEVLVRID